MIIRDVTEADLPAIAAVYVQHVLTGLASFEETPPSVEEMTERWRALSSRGLPYIVAIIDERIVGYSYAGPYRGRSAYRFTVEDSVYVAEGSGGRGVGSALLAALIERCRTGPWQQMVAVIGDLPFPGHQVGRLLCCKMSNASLELGSYIKHRIRVLSLCSWSMKMCRCWMTG